jgi:hypothetical protein
LFREVWYWCVIYNFVDENSNDLTKETIESIQNIAKNSPILKGNKIYNYLEIKTEIETLIDKTNIKIVDFCCDTLSSYLPKSTNLKKMKGERIIFLLLIYHLGLFFFKKNNNKK